MKKVSIGAELIVLLLIITTMPIATAQTFDNSGGGTWSEYYSFPITVTPTSNAQYRISITNTTWELYNTNGSLEANGTNADFWNIVNTTGADIRVFNQKYMLSSNYQDYQLYFWIEYFNATERKAIIWVNLTPDSTELNIAYGNPNALPSSYNNPKMVALQFNDFDEYIKWNIYPKSADGLSGLEIANGWLNINTGASDKGLEARNLNIDDLIIKSRFKINSVGNTPRLFYDFRTESLHSKGYVLSIKPADNRVEIWKDDGTGTYVQVGGVDYTINTGQEYDLEIKANGSTLEIYIDGSLVLSVTDTSYTSGTVCVYGYDIDASIDYIEVYDLNGSLIFSDDFSETLAVNRANQVEVSVSNSILSIRALSDTQWGSVESLERIAPVGTVFHVKAKFSGHTSYASAGGLSFYMKRVLTSDDTSNTYSIACRSDVTEATDGDGAGNYATYPFSQSYTGQYYIWEIRRFADKVEFVNLNSGEVITATQYLHSDDDFIGFHDCSAPDVTLYVDYFAIFSTNDPADFGTPLVKFFQKKFGTKTVYVNVTYLDTSTTERYNPTAYYKLEDKPQINVTSQLSISGVNSTYGANISIELIDFVTLDKVVYNGTDITTSLTYQGTKTNVTTGYIYKVYNFTTYENGLLEIYGHVSNKAYEAIYKLDEEIVDISNVTSVIGEPLEITIPHKGNISIESIQYTGITSVPINTKDLGIGAKTITIIIEDPENFTVGYKSETINIEWGKIYFNITDLQGKVLTKTTYGFFNKNFSILSTDPTKLYAGDIEIDVYFHDVKLKSLEIHLNHSNNGLTLNVSVNATQFKDYRNMTRIIASPNYFEVVNLSTKYPFSVMKLVNVSGTVVIDFVSNAPTSVKVEGATSYTYEKPVLKITASGNVTITDLYKLSTPLKDRLGNPVNFYILINGSRVDASNGIASKLLKPSWYEVEVPITVAGFELWKFNDSSNIALVEINTSDETLPTAEYRVPTKIETKEVRIQKKQFPWLPFPFLSENKPAQEETPIVRLEGTLRDFYNAPIANRTIKIEVASPNFTRIYNVTTDSSGNFKVDVDMARGVEYKVTYKFAGDDVYVSSSTTKTFTIEQLLPAPPEEEMTIEEILIFVGIAVGLIAVVAGAIYLAKRTKAKTLARMESEFRFFRRIR